MACFPICFDGLSFCGFIYKNSVSVSAIHPGKRLRDPLFSPYKRVSTFVLKKMERRSIQEYAEEYKNRLKAGEDLDF
ncbi:hypothetical protein, partial [Parabacteroides sp.]